jgi:Intra-flagellar transport protein 57
MQVQVSAEECMLLVMHKLYLLDFRSKFYASKYGCETIVDQVPDQSVHVHIYTCMSKLICQLLACAKFICCTKLALLAKSLLNPIERTCRKHRPLLDQTFLLSTSAPRNASDQFFCFINLAAWMLTEFGGPAMAPIKEGDDPMAALQSLLAALSKLNFDVPSSYTQARLQSGAGREVCAILNGLADWSLQQSTFTFGQPEHPQGDDYGRVLRSELTCCKAPARSFHVLARIAAGQLVHTVNRKSLAEI